MIKLSFLRRWFQCPSRRSLEPLPPQSDPTDADAQFIRGLRSASGEGAAQDYPQAAHWYGLAAEQNHSLAQFNLAVMYGQGQGVLRDPAKALMWLTRAANLGDAAAQFKLGMQQYLGGRGNHTDTGPETRIEALKWVHLAATQGYRGAANAAEFVALAMPIEEVAEGGRRAGVFVAG